MLQELTNANVDQYFIRVKEQEKFDTMTRLMDVDQPELSIVFGRTKTSGGRVDTWLETSWFPVQRLSTVTLTKNKRLRVIRDFKNGKSISWLQQTLQRVVLTFQV